MKSLLYLIAILASFFLLLLFGALAGGLVLSPAGLMPALFGAVAGAVAGLCGWFKVVGYFVELENIQLSDRPTAAPEDARPADGGLALSDRDVRSGNHLMACGAVAFISSLFSSPGIALVVGAAGVASVAAGFIISLTGVEFPSEEGIVRRVRLLVARGRD